MTGVELVLLLIGSIFMVGSFFITEKLSPSELNKIAELSENELKKIINRGLENAGKRIDAAIEEHIEVSADQVDRALEKETNEKIMAISEYSDTVIESMNKTHNEIMFLYSMLNDKHTELTGMVSNLQRIAADVRELEENLQTLSQTVPAAPVTVQEMPAPSPVPASAQSAAGRADGQAAAAAGVQGNVAREQFQGQEAASEEGELSNVNAQILALHRQGMSEIEIARRLDMGVGEVRLVIGLYRGERES